jgi:Rod binding domain-containing protein
MSDPLSAIMPLTGPTAAIDYRQTNRLQKSGTGGDQDAREIKLRKAVQDFESLFMYKLLKSMRSTVPKSDNPGFGMETMRDITDEQLAIYLARQGGIGLGEMMYQSLKQRGEQAEDCDKGAGLPGPAATEQAAMPLNAGETARPIRQLGKTKDGASGRDASEAGIRIER